MIKSYTDLEVWQKSVDLVEDIYKIYKNFPKEECYILESPIKRAIISVPSNIAEGSKRGGNKDFINFLRISHGSLCEVQTQLLIPHRLNYTSKELYVEVYQKSESISMMLNKFISSLRKTLNEKRKTN